jgi:hypothetical protein
VVFNEINHLLFGLLRKNIQNKIIFIDFEFKKPLLSSNIFFKFEEFRKMENSLIRLCRLDYQSPYSIFILHLLTKFESVKWKKKKNCQSKEKM